MDKEFRDVTSLYMEPTRDVFKKCLRGGENERERESPFISGVFSLIVQVVLSQ